MPTSKEKFEIVIEARERASVKIRRLKVELANLGGPQMVRSQKEIKKLSREITQLSGSAKKGSIFFSRFTQGIAAGNIIANATTASFKLLKQGITEIGKAIMIAAEVQELGTVLNFVGQRAGYSTEEIDGFVDVGILKSLMTKSLLTARLKGYTIAQSIVEIGSLETILFYKKLGFHEKKQKECEFYREKFGRNGLSLLEIEF